MSSSDQKISKDAIDINKSDLFFNNFNTVEKKQQKKTKKPVVESQEDNIPDCLKGIDQFNYLRQSPNYYGYNPQPGNNFFFNQSLYGFNTKL